MSLSPLFHPPLRHKVPDHFPVDDLLLTGRVSVVLPSLLTVAHGPEHLRPVTPIWTADVDLCVHFHNLALHICPLSLFDAHENDLTHSVPEGTSPSRLSRSERPFALHRLLVVHFNELSKHIHDFLSLLCSCEPSKILSPKLSSTSMHIGQQVPSTREVLARTLRWSVNTKHLQLAGICAVLDSRSSVRIPPVVLTASRRAPPIALLLRLLRAAPTVRLQDPPDKVFD